MLAQARQLQAMLKDVRSQRGSPGAGDSAKPGAFAEPGNARGWGGAPQGQGGAQGLAAGPDPSPPGGVDGNLGAAELAPAVSVGGTLCLPGTLPINLDFFVLT